MQKIRLMQITHDLGIGGLPQVVVNICKAVDRDRFDVSVLCLRDFGELASQVEDLGIRVILLPQKKKGTDYFTFLKVGDILRKERVEIIHTHNTQPLVDGTMGALMSPVKTIVHTDHARTFPDKKRYMFAEWLLSHRVYKMVGVSERTSLDLIKYEKISPRKIVTIPNGIDGSGFQMLIDKKAKKQELGIRSDGPIIGFVGRLVEQKGISYALKALPEVLKEFRDVTFVIAGYGPMENTLKEEAFSLGISDNVVFVGPRLDIPELMSLFDLFLLPSKWEGLPIVILEAMASGCPIIATDVGGLSSVIQNGANGSLVEPRNPRALSAEIIKLLKDDELSSKYRRNSRETFRDKLSAETMMRQYEKLYLREI